MPRDRKRTLEFITSYYSEDRNGNHIFHGTEASDNVSFDVMRQLVPVDADSTGMFAMRYAE